MQLHILRIKRMMEVVSLIAIVIQLLHLVCVCFQKSPASLIVFNLESVTSNNSEFSVSFNEFKKLRLTPS